MYLVLLVFGALLAAAGIVLAVPGVSLHEHTFDATTVTPGIVAVIGGLVLIALGLALRVLRRIERALSAQPMPHAERSSEPALRLAASELSNEAVRAMVPPKPVPRSRLASRTASDEKAPIEAAERLPGAARFEIQRTVAELDLALSPKPVVPRSLLSQPLMGEGEDETIGEAKDMRLGRRIGSAAGGRLTPRLDLSVRPPNPGERAKGPSFETMWPKGPRPSRVAQQPATAPAAVPADEPEQTKEPVLETQSPPIGADEAPVTILKSGVVDGMAYTLFSDGSIEAELPQGRLRFGSITELRNHIEQSA